MRRRELDARKDEKDSILSNKVEFSDRARKLFPVVLAALLGACANGTVLLNSERIEQKFGSYGIEVLHSDDGLRRSNLYSTENQQQTCRTYAVVRFSSDIDASYAALHERVLAGESLGKIFKANGWFVQKKTIHIATVESAQSAPVITQLMRLSPNRTLALHIYQLSLRKGEQSFEYATIIEAHHPDYLSVEDLRAIYFLDDANAISAESASELVRLALVNSDT